RMENPPMANEVIRKGDRPEGAGKPVPQSLIARVMSGVRYMVTGEQPDWFGPMEPIQPVAQEAAEGRQFDYPVGYNLRIEPRSDEGVSFYQMRTLADSYDLLRLVIETRKDEIVKLDWTFQLTDEKAKATDEQNARINALNDLFQYPDGEHSWEIWLRMLLEDMLVIDAATIYPRPNKGGGIYGFELIDGATIKRVINEDGRTPLPPDVAYQQVLHGIPAVDYSSDELLYLPQNQRTHKIYGYSPVEQVIMTVNIAIRRQIHQLQFYTEGNIPEALMGLPMTWTMDQTKAFQRYWDDLIEGNTAVRRHMRFVPTDIAKNYVPLKEPVLKDEYDEWLARIVCFAFSISPTPFIKQMNRATADTQKEEAREQGLIPRMRSIKNVMNLITHKFLQQPDISFGWKIEEATDPVDQATIDTEYVKAGIFSIDEVRSERGKDPVGASRPMVWTANGYVSIDPVTPAAPEETEAGKLAKAKKKVPLKY
ncbi:MAG: phage portal protein, partial [Burkholderiales bacterium]